jgi:hypothetical protein
MDHYPCLVTQGILAIVAMIVTLVQLVFALPQVPQAPASDFGEIKDSKQAFALLNDLAKDAVSTDSNLGRTRVSISAGVLSYDFQPAPDSSISRPNRLTSPLELLIRIEALTRDFQRSVPTESFWAPPLDHLRSVAASMVEGAFSAPAEDQWLSRKQEFEDRVGQDFALLAQETLAFARKAGLDVVATRGSVGGYKVEVRIDPPKAHIKFMTFLDYRRCNAFKLDLKNYWVDLYAGQHMLIGKYRYLAEWPASLSEADEDNFDITEEGTTLTFRPKEK